MWFTSQAVLYLVYTILLGTFMCFILKIKQVVYTHAHF